MKGFKNIPIKLKCEPITIKEPYKPDVKEFADTEEFTHYFRANEELFKEPSSDPASTPDGASARRDKPSHFLTTNKLNRTYKIPGYRIRIINKGKDNEELTLVKDYYLAARAGNECCYSRPSIEEPLKDSINDKIVEMEQSIADIVERINNIESFLLQLKR